MPAYTVNEDAVRHAKRLIDARQYVLRSRWQDVQPRAREQNAFLKTHSWEEYAAWHLGLTEGAAEETKARYAFVYGDFRRLHRMGLIACHYRAAEWRHKEIELAAHELLQYLDRKTARQSGGVASRPGVPCPNRRTGGTRRLPGKKASNAGPCRRPEPMETHTARVSSQRVGEETSYESLGVGGSDRGRIDGASVAVPPCWHPKSPEGC